MKYLLDKEEYEALVPKQDFERLMEHATKLAMLLATTDGPDCIHDKRGTRGVCDCCSAQPHCPLTKKWSK